MWAPRGLQAHPCSSAYDNHMFKVPANKGTRRVLAARRVHGAYRTAGRGLQPEHVKHGRGLRQSSGVRGVLVAGGVSAKGVLVWHVIEGKWTGAKAAEVYSGPMQDALVKAFPKKRSFQVLEDNDPVGNQSKAGLAAKRKAKITLVELPKRSPDLNVLDFHVWAEVEKRLRRQESKWPKDKKETRAEFIRRLQRTVQRLSAKHLQKAIGDLSWRTEALYKAKGGLFEEGGRKPQAK